LANNSLQVTFTENNDMVETFAAQGTNYSLHVGRLPGTAWCDGNLLNFEGPQLVLEQQTIYAIAISDEIARRFSVVERLDQLTRGLLGSRMFRHVEMHDFAAIMSKHDQDEQDTCTIHSALVMMRG
jgi:hypothetical protein